MIFLDHKSLADLVDRARNGDEQAFHQIYEHTADIQYHQILQILQNPEDAQDALQDTYLLLYQHLDKIKSPRCLIAYLNRLSFFISKNAKKRSERFHSRAMDMEILDDMKTEEISLSDAVEAKETRNDIRRALDSLPEQERLILTMHYYQNMTLKQVAYAMGVSLTTAKRIHRLAKQHLKMRLERRGIHMLVSAAVPAMLHELTKEGILIKTPDFTLNPASTSFSSRLSVSQIPSPPSRLTISFMGGAAIPAGLAAVTASAAIAFSHPTSLSVDKVEQPMEYVSAPAEINVKTKGVLPVKEAHLSSSSGKKLWGKSINDGTIRFKVPENGSYILKLTSFLGHSCSQKVQVNCIDSKRPDILSLKHKGQDMIVTFSENESGIDPQSLYCETESGLVTLYHSYDKDTQKAVFRLPPENNTLYFSDIAGNAGRAVLEYSKPE